MGTSIGQTTQDKYRQIKEVVVQFNIDEEPVNFLVYHHIVDRIAKKVIENDPVCVAMTEAEIGADAQLAPILEGIPTHGNRVKDADIAKKAAEAKAAAEEAAAIEALKVG